MRLLLLLMLTLACFALGPDNPVFFMVGFVLFGWFVIAMMAGSVRWLVSLTAPSPGRSTAQEPWHTNQAGKAPASPGWSCKAATQTRVCPDDRCGRVNTGQARFCAQCGRRLA